MLETVKRLTEEELFDDLTEYVALHFKQCMLDDQLDLGELALLHKLTADAHFHTESFHEAIYVSFLSLSARF